MGQVGGLIKSRLHQVRLLYTIISLRQSGAGVQLQLNLCYLGL